MEAFLDKIFGFSEMGIVQNRNIPKKSFYEQDAFNTARKILFTDDIEKLKIIAICDQNTTNIEPFVNEDRMYKEILFIQAELKDIAKQKKISKIMHQVIPNPVFIIFTYKDEFLLSIANKRLNKQEKGKIVVESEYNSPWVNVNNTEEVTTKFIKQLYLKNFSFDNLYAFYSDITKAIIFASFIELINDYRYSKSVDLEELTKLADQYKKLNEAIVFHSNEDKRLKNFGDKVSNHQKLIDAKKELELLKQLIINFKT